MISTSCLREVEGHPQSREFEFLCCTAGVWGRRDRARLLLSQGIDWRWLSDLAGAHGVRPQLLRVLRSECWSDVPAEVQREFEVFQRYHLARSLHIANELINIGEQFTKKGIRYAVFKGVALSILLYKDLAGREFNDIDVIVDEKDVRLAEKIIESFGYVAPSGNAQFRTAFLSYQRQYQFVDKAANLAVDLHWDFVGSGEYFPISTSEIWSTLGSASIAGRDIPTLGLSELAIFLAGHGTKEGWRSLGWIIDFGEFLQQNPDLEWDTVYRRARHHRCGRSILLATSLAVALLGVRITPALANLMAQDPGLRPLTERVLKRVLQGTTAPRYPWSELCERWPQRLRACLMLLSNRTTGDFEALPLPRQMWRLYHLTRPIRLAIRGLSSDSENSGG
jgi:hypothetical protein